MLKFKKTNYIAVQGKEPQVPEGLWIKCEACGEMLYKEDVKANRYICYKCGKYFRLTTKKRLQMVADKGSYEKWDEGLENENPLDYPDYLEKIESLKERCKIDEAVTCGKCTIHGEEAVVCVCDGRFLMGSMGYVVGEKNHKSRRACNKRTVAGYYFHLFRWSQNAGRYGIFDADGKNFSSVKASLRGRTFVYFRINRSDYRWCDSKFCNAW